MSKYEVKLPQHLDRKYELHVTELENGQHEAVL